VAELLDEGYLAERRRLIRFDRASVSEGERWRPDRLSGAVEAGFRPALTRAGASSDSGAPSTRGGVASTTHLSAVDAAGNVASITQSLGHGFGSGTFIPGTGLAMNSFCHWFEIDPRCPTPNVIAPGKRWASCMAPLHVLNGAVGEPAFWFSLSTPGSWGILHTTVQMLSNVIDHGADLQGAIDAARFRLWEGTRMQIETRVPETVRTALSARGHQLEPIGDYSYLVGGAQGVMIDPASGYRVAAADPRRDGVADAA
jgi:gamma-glutamyltranspeptidase/glutathione hydrolase